MCVTLLFGDYRRVLNNKVFYNVAGRSSLRETFTRSLEAEETIFTDRLLGVHGARETPVPIPNTAVKPRSGYNTWGSPLGK